MKDLHKLQLARQDFLLVHAMDHCELVPPLAGLVRNDVLDFNMVLVGPVDVLLTVELVQNLKIESERRRILGFDHALD